MYHHVFLPQQGTTVTFCVWTAMGLGVLGPASFYSYLCTRSDRSLCLFSPAPDAQHMMIDLGTGNNNKINWPMEEPQEFIDIVEVRETVLLAPCPLDVAVTNAC